MTKIAFVLGTRPEIIKLYSMIRDCEKHDIDHYVVNTDQHYDANMRDVFFTELGLRTPKYQLGVGSASHAKMLAKMLVAIEEVFENDRPDVVVVQGDTNTVLAGCLVANKMGIKVAHVEAGLRSYDRTMPEEYNRVVVDHCADYLFAPTKQQADILITEGIDRQAIHVTGNTVVDAVYALSSASQPPDGRYMLLTTHRPANTDEPGRLEVVLNAIQDICRSEDMRCIFPVHPRLNNRLNFIREYDRIDAVDPMGYIQLLGTIKGAAMIFTDSGGIQEEACILERKCVILRTNTERPETLEVGGAVLIDEFTEDNILQKYTELSARSVVWSNPFGDGKAGERIIKIISGKS